VHPISKKVLRPIFKALASPGLVNPHSPFEIELMIAGIKPVAIVDPESRLKEYTNNIDSQNILNRWNEMINSGQIVLIGKKDFSDIGEMEVYAQADKLKEGHELFARYYKNNEGYSPLEGREWHERIGELLGFTSNDVSLAKAMSVFSGFIRNQNCGGLIIRDLELKPLGFDFEIASSHYFSEYAIP